MIRAAIAILLSLALAGCSSTEQLVASVRGYIPGQKDQADQGAEQAAGSEKNDAAPASAAAPLAALGTEIDPVSHEQSDKPTGEIAESIVARVNGDPILAQDLFTPIRSQLAQAQREMPPAQFAQFRNTLLQKKLRDLIELQLLIQEAKKNVPEAGIKSIEAAADKEFGNRIESEMKRMEVNTESELRRKMLENNESLDQMREYHRRTFLAQQYLRIKLMPRLDVSREEMINYYNAHLDEYRKEEAVKWSEIFVSSEKFGSPERAKAKADELVATLRSGADFAQVAAKESEGATASDGGKWGWTTRGSYIIAAVDQALFSLKRGEVSDPIEGPRGWHIVRIDEKQGGGETSFVDVQEEIRKAIREQKIAQESQRYVQELARKALISTIFDAPAQARSR